MDLQTLYQKAILFAALKHSEKNQTLPGTKIPYVVHLSNVAMEIMIASNNSNFDINFAVQLALLHDILEDTDTTYEELKIEFNDEVALGVLALTKNEKLPKEEKMTDSLNRIKKMRKEVWSVKLADRITNLQTPPQHWDNLKKISYQQEAKTILNILKDGNKFLENRLSIKIEDYGKYIDNSVT